MKVKCVDNNDGWCNLTIGKEYEIADHGTAFGDYYTIINDNDVKHTYHKSFFEIINKNTKESYFTITLTKEEVNTLVVLLCSVGGTMRSPRKYADSILNKLGISMTWTEYDELPETNLLVVKDNGFFFYDYPEEKSPKQLKIEELQGTIEEMKKQVEQLKKEIL